MSSTAPTSACVIGVGGLGCSAALALAAGGLRHLTLVDPDVVELSNLHRQVLHHDADLGRPKVDSAAEKLFARYPDLIIERRHEAATSATVEAMMRAADVTLDATDGVRTKFMLSDAAVRARARLVYAGVLRFDGLAMRVEPGGPCLRCLFEAMPTDAPTCAQAGVLGAMAATMGALQGLLALGRNEQEGSARLHIVDGATLTTRAIAVPRRAECTVCGAERS